MRVHRHPDDSDGARDDRHGPAGGRRHRVRTETAYAAKLEAPFAVLGIRTVAGCISGIDYLPLKETVQAPSDALAELACRQLQRYLADARFRFTLPLVVAGTAFRRKVWQALSRIPVGESRTYGELGRELHSAPRAIGGACGANPIALVIPCHRVVGARGAMGGFMGATQGDPIAIKRWLLTHEGYRFGA